ncbi:DUF4328 domain-containing protein [Streptomyces sp. NPDC087420]|uniref:DUF4328 domain-containing protein n=1 Tax=Streptomyces sp. NPDC087420 TaxID=3365785 RepID=UPI003834D59C
MTRADSFYDVAFSLLGIVGVPLGVVFITWFYRVRVNAQVFAPEGHRLSTARAVGG